MLFEVIEGNKNSKENDYFSISLKRIQISKFCDTVPSILILCTIKKLNEIETQLLILSQIKNLGM